MYNGGNGKNLEKHMRRNNAIMSVKKAVATTPNVTSGYPRINRNDSESQYDDERQLTADLLNKS